MPLRQQALFRVGCWLTLVTAAVHLVGALAGRPAPANALEVQLFALAADYRFALPGAERSLFDLLDGFSLAVSLQLAAMGVTGLAVAKRAGTDATLMVAVARTCALTMVGLLVVSIAYWFLVPSLLLAMASTAFVFASVRPPAD